jgi:hypothetical protein
MPEGLATLKQLLSESARNVFVLSLGFEDRCCALPKALRGIDRTRNRVLCIEHSDSNVSPVGVLQRRRLRDSITQAVGPEFCQEHSAQRAIADALRTNRAGIIIDSSTMPRRLILQLLRTISENNPEFARTWLFDCGPGAYLSYVSGELEITDPAIATVFDEPDVTHHDRISVVLFPGFNCFETSSILARLINPTRRAQSLTVRWVFCHPGAKYEFYERAMLENSAFIRHFGVRIAGQHQSLCRMDSAEDIAAQVIAGARDLAGDGALVVANAGPRVLLGPAFLAVHALRKRIHANLLVTQPLAYRTVRSTGEGELRAWNLEAEAAKIGQQVAKSLSA